MKKALHICLISAPIDKDLFPVTNSNSTALFK